MKMFSKQKGRCFYCEVKLVIPTRPMYNKGCPPNLATREHLYRQIEGGKSTPDNIVLACSMCNSSRQETPWEIYREQKRNKKYACVS